MARIVGTLALALAAWSNTAGRSSADVFVLSTGGRIDGELLNPEQSPRVQYVVKTAGGARLTLEAEQVEFVEPVSDSLRRYESFVATLPDTAEAHWQAAEGCLKANLKVQRTFHLEQVLRHDANHEGARRALGYSKLEGKWVRPEEHMEGRGYVQHRGEWRTAQEVFLERHAIERDSAINEWRKKLRLWRSWVTKRRGRDEEVSQNIRAIREPAAIPVLLEMLRDADEPEFLKRACIEALGRMQAHAAIGTLVQLSLEDSRAEVRDASLSEVAKWGSVSGTPLYVAALKHKSNEVVNRAGEALTRMNDSSVTGSLIDALTTKHRYLVGVANNMNVGFNPNGGIGGMSVGGGGPKSVDRDHQNPGVLAALTSLNPGANHSYDKDAWRRWYVESQTPRKVDLRRSE